jgi:hypothetical protein
VVATPPMLSTILPLVFLPPAPRTSWIAKFKYLWMRYTSWCCLSSAGDRLEIESVKSAIRASWKRRRERAAQFLGSSWSAWFSVPA